MNVALPTPEGNRLSSGTITTHRHPSVRRAIAMVVAIAVLVQSAACSYVPTRPDERACAQEKAEALASATDQAINQDAIFFNVTADGSWRCAAAVPKDVYDARVFVTWSDGKTEESGDFFISVEPGRQYSVLAYEVGVGYVPATAMLTARQAPSTSKGGGLGGGGGAVGLVLLAVVIAVVIVAVVVAAPFGIASKISKSKQAEAKNARWATNCCHVWIEDARTRETIAGVAPSAQ